MKKVAFVVGHKLTAQGAVNYLYETEYAFNTKVLKYVKQEFGNDVKVFTKTVGYVKRVKLFEPSLVIELHFNSFHVKAYGCESLAIKSSQNSISQALNFTKAFNRRFNIKNRGVKLLSSKLDRGYSNFNGLRNHPMFLFEPCFANFKTKDSEKIILNWRDYGDFLIDYLNCYLGYNEKVTENILDKMIAIMQSWFPRRIQ